MAKSFLNHIYDDSANEACTVLLSLECNGLLINVAKLILTYESLCIIQKVAVALSEIFFYLLKARLSAVSHLWSVRHLMTARVVLMAVDIREIFFYLLQVKISYKNVLPSLLIKISISDCLQAIYFSSVGTSFSQE